MLQAYTNATIFTGSEWIENHAVIVSGDTIETIVLAEQLPADMERIDCNQQLLVPTFLDLQIYGAAGKLFSAYPGNEALQLLAEHNATCGTGTCLVTIATQPMPTILACIEAIKTYWQQGGKGIMGMHLEGPFINATKRGAHIEEWVQSPTMEEVKTLLQKADGVIKIVTLAPECVDEAVIREFAENGVIVSIGHSNASFAEATRAMNNGASTVTHLYNAMSPLHHREPGLVGAAMQHGTAAASIIPDGIHVDYEAVKIAKQIMGERLFFITDAVTDTSVGPYQHVLNTDHYDLPNGTLSGSALTMLKAVQNAVQHCNISLEEALRMASLYPARVMGLHNSFGKIETGFAAQFALVSKDLSTAGLHGSIF
ncbi:MAG: N-acetylglucosamine-6-phosphate deacetylase [Bacteroidota bacterium]